MNPVDPVQAEPVHDLSGERRLYLRLCGTALAAYASYSLVRTPVLPLFAREQGLSTSMVGLIVAASTITGVFLKFPAGALSDVIGRRRMLVAGALVFAVSPFFYLLPHSALTLLVLRFVHGSATAVFGPVMAAVISDLAPKARRGSWLGTYSAAQSGGNAAGQLLGGTLLSIGGFAYPFLAGGACGIAAFILLPRVGTSAPLEISAPAVNRLREAMHAVLSDRVILLVSIATAGQYIGNGALNGFLPLYAREAAGLEAWQIGALFGAQTGCVLAFRPMLGTLSDRWGRAPLMMAGMLSSSVLLVVLPMLRSFTSLLVLTSLYGAAFAATSATSMAWITDLAARRHFGTAHGAYGTIFDIGDATGPIAAGLLISSFGYTVGFRILAVPLAVLIVLLAANASLTRHRSPQA